MQHETTSKSASHSGATGGSAPIRRSDQQQIDVGTYILHHGLQQVGELYVEAHATDPNNAALRVEHWGLYQNFKAPSSANRLYDVKFEYKDAQDANANDFRARLRTIQGVRYIQADCREQAP